MNNKKREEKRNKLLKSSTNSEIAQIAYNAALWYKTSFLQTIRCLEVANQEHKEPFDLPWSENNDFPLVSEKLYLLIAVDHALGNINILNDMLNERCDNRLDEISKSLLNTDCFYENIKFARNANEHDIEYRLGNGHQQNKFLTKISTKRGNIVTNAQWYIQVNEELFIGNIKVMDMFEHLHKYRDELLQLLSTIHTEYF